MTDPIADMLTRLRNANTAFHDDVLMPSSKVKEALAKILVSEGYVEGYAVEHDPERPSPRLRITLKYQYVERWLSGVGAAAIHNLMEDAATAEISRAQLWQWLRNTVNVETSSGTRQISKAFYEDIREAELKNLGGRSTGRYADAAKILDDLVFSERFEEFLTLPAYRLLN